MGTSESEPFLGENVKGPEETKEEEGVDGVWQDVFTAVMVMN